MPLCKSKFAKKIGPPTRLIEIFIAVDDFVPIFEHWLASRCLSTTRKPTRQPDLVPSELLNALAHTMAGLVAYNFYDNKPSVFVKPIQI